jgi:peptide/nickel transport system permease protein
VFYSSLLLILLFSFTLGWFPATGQGGVERPVLPAVALGLTSSAVLARLVRSSMLDVLHQEYVTTARAKGLLARLVVGRHALKNALIPAVTMLGLQLGALLGGAVITETVFSRPGLGRLAVDAIASRDFPLVQATVLFAAIDPRIARHILPNTTARRGASSSSARGGWRSFLAPRSC